MGIFEKNCLLVLKKTENRAWAVVARRTDRERKIKRRSSASGDNIPTGTGYTLIEVLIAVAIFSIGIMAMGALQSASLINTGDISRFSEAWTLLDDRTERLKALPFYQTVLGIDYNDDGTVDTATAFFPDLTPGSHSWSPLDGRYSVNWQITDDQPIGPQSALDLPWPGLPDIGPNYTVSKTITVWVNRAGSASQADALAIVRFVKTWAGDGVVF